MRSESRKAVIAQEYKDEREVSILCSSSPAFR